MSNASNLSNLANVLDDGSDGQFLKSTGSGGVAFDTVAAGAVVYATADLLPLSGNSAGDMAYVTATNRFYINNGSGWYSVSLVNTNPNITSVQDAGSNTTPFTLATDGTATVITVTAADPEEVPLTYGYSVTSGSLNGSTVAQGTGSNSNVFTVTPHASQDATFTITFTASDGINQAASANVFSLSFVTTVTDSKYTTLLATATGTSDNNNITDSSSNSHSITVNGDAHAGTFSPYRSGGYSSYGHFRPETASNTLDTYSLSFWYKFNSVVNAGYLFETQSGSFSMRGETASGGRFEIGGALYFQNDGSGNNCLDNNWHYFVVSRTSSATSWYIDGSQITTDMFGGAVTLTLGSLSAQAVRNMTFGGRDATSDLGALATTNRADVKFRDIELKSTTHDGSVPTEPVTPSSDTVFLTAHKPNSLYEYGSTPTSALLGTVGTNFKTIATSPYDYNEYSATDHGGSVYFDGSSDNLSLTANSGFSLDGNFTIECWFNPSSITLDSQHPSILKIGTTQIYLNSSNNYVGFYHGTNDLVKSANSSITENQWYHVSVTRSGTLLTLFLNGVSVDTGNYTATFGGSSGTVYIGTFSGTGGDYHGYIGDLRIVKGTVVYSGNFTPPTSPLSSSGASLHIKGTDASIIDKSQGTNIDLGSTSIVGHSTTKWSGANSIYINSHSNNSDIITIPAGVLDASEPFTIEMWLKTLMGSASGFWSIYQDASNIMRLKMRGDDRLEFYHRGSGASAQEILDVTNTYTLNNADFYHVAITRDSNSVFYLHQNGIKLGNFTANGDYDSLNTPFIIGKSQPATERYMNGYIQDFRITQGLARYTADDESANIPSAPLEG